MQNLTRNTLLIVLTLLSFLSYAQENYISGYVITIDGERQEGLIDFRNWGRNPSKIKFKSNANAISSEFQPLQITEFGVEGHVYNSAIIETEISSSVDLTEDKDPIIETDTTFLKTLIRGDKSLFHYRDEDNKENYYIKEGDNYSLLIYKKYLRYQAKDNISQRAVLAENKRYLGQLAVYLASCNSIQSKFEDVDYKERDLVRLFNYFYECSEAELSFQRDKDKTKVSIGPIAGATITSPAFSSTSVTYISDTDYGSSTNSAFGLFVDLISEKNQGKWSIYNELLLTKFEVSGSLTYSANAGVSQTDYTEFGYSTFKLSSSIRYKRSFEKVALFFKGGLSYGLVSKVKNFRRTTTTNNIREREAIPGIVKREFGIPIGVGIEVDKLFIETRFEFSPGISDINDIGATTNRLFFLLGYRID